MSRILASSELLFRGMTNYRIDRIGTHRHALDFIPLPLFCRVDVVEFGVDACRCAPMRADAIDAVISHTLCFEYVYSY